MKKQKVTLETISQQILKLEAKMDARFEQVDARFEQVDARFEQVDARFEQFEVKMASSLERLDAKIDTDIESLAMHVQQGFLAERKITNARFDSLEEKFSFMRQDMNQMNLRICDIQAALPKFVTRDEFEERLTSLGT